MMPTPLFSSKARLSEGVVHARSLDDLGIAGHRVLQPDVMRGPSRGYRESDGTEDLDADTEAVPRKSWRRPGVLLLMLVLLPTLLVAAFEYGIAADQYESEAHFIVRSPQASSGASGIGQLLGINSVPAPSDAHSVGDYLLSHDALEALRPRLDLTAIFRRPEADPLTRLWSATPPRETLLQYYRDKVHATYSSETGITTLTVRTFRRDDAKRLADDLLGLGEERVNTLNTRMFEDGLATAHRQVGETAVKVEQAGSALTLFRQRHRDIDPDRTSVAQIQLASQLQERAAAARAEFEAMASVIPRTAPQYAANARRVFALEARVAATKAQTAGSAQSVAASLGEFEALRLKQEFAAKSYAAAATSFESAKEQLLKQQLFIVPVVKPNLPDKSLYPKRLQTIAVVFFSLLLTFAVGWLILAGVREHAA